MNSSGFVRGLMAKQKQTDEYLSFVMKTIIAELKREDVDCYLELWARDETANYLLTVNYNDKSYTVKFSQETLLVLKKDWPYALDKYLWQALFKEGLIYNARTGNYLANVGY